MGLLATIETNGRLERIPLPDLRRGVQMPSLPAWLASRIGSLRIETQRDPVTDKYRPTPTLPANLILSAVERDEIERHLTELERMCALCPMNDPASEEETFKVVGKLMLAPLASMTPNEASAEVCAEVFMMVLDDVPTWASAAAVWRWCRGDAGKNDRGQPYDCHWRPAPADLRAIARLELWRVTDRIAVLRKLLCAEVLIEYTAEHCTAMRGKLVELFRSLGSPPVGTQDSSGGEISAN